MFGSWNPCLDESSERGFEILPVQVIATKGFRQRMSVGQGIVRRFLIVKGSTGEEKEGYPPRRIISKTNSGFVQALQSSEERKRSQSQWTRGYPRGKVLWATQGHVFIVPADAGTS